nr:MAG TPA: hypothetical protein [Caudoviricetes sp.]
MYSYILLFRTRGTKQASNQKRATFVLKIIRI